MEEVKSLDSKRTQEYWKVSYFKCMEKNGEGEKDLCISESNKDEKTQLKSSTSLLRNQIWTLLWVFLIQFQHQKAMNNEY